MESDPERGSFSKNGRMAQWKEEQPPSSGDGWCVVLNKRKSKAVRKQLKAELRLADQQKARSKEPAERQLAEVEERAEREQIRWETKAESSRLREVVQFRRQLTITYSIMATEVEKESRTDVPSYQCERELESSVVTQCQAALVQCC